jgi:FtsH-binding integral membrane protein
MSTQTVSYETEAKRKTEADCVRRITPPSLKDVSLLRLVERCATLLPMLLLVSTVGCLVGHYFLLVPLDHLGVVVSVPMVIGFLLVKWAMCALPFDPEEVKKHKRPPAAFRFFAFVMIISAVLSVSFLLSSPAYFLLGWAGLGDGALRFAAVGFGLALLGLIGGLQQVGVGELLALLVAGLWRIAILFLFPRLFVSRFHHGGGAAAGA